jgi:hypothetical protein
LSKKSGHKSLKTMRNSKRAKDGVPQVVDLENHNEYVKILILFILLILAIDNTIVKKIYLSIDLLYLEASVGYSGQNTYQFSIILAHDYRQSNGLRHDLLLGCTATVKPH